MEWSEGPKLFHECFLKFLALMDCNYFLKKLILSLKNVEGWWRLLPRMENQSFVNTIESLAGFYEEFVN